MLLLVALGCKPDPTVIDGDVDGRALNEPATVMWGGPFVLFSDVELTCFDVSWVRRTYDQAEAPTEFDIVALQFAFDNTEPVAGTFSVQGSEAAVSAKSVVVTGGAFIETRGREGNLVIDGPVEAGQPMSGQFWVNFGEDDDGNSKGDYETNWFYAEYCSNLIRN